LDKKIREHFIDVINLARDVFDHVEAEMDSTPERAILRLKAQYGPYRIFITELFNEQIRKYRYYILRDDWVEAGFDNSPDPRALRERYGQIGEEHAGEYIPHLHLENKTRLSLTEEMTFEAFVDWLRDNLAATDVEN